MLPLQIVLVGHSIGLLRKIYHGLDRQGHLISVRTGGPSPMLTLTRTGPELLILELGSGLGSLETWRRAIHSYRSRCKISVLAVGTKKLDREPRRFVEDVADLGVLIRPFSTEELVHRIDDWISDGEGALLTR